MAARAGGRGQGQGKRARAGAGAGAGAQGRVSAEGDNCQDVQSKGQEWRLRANREH